MTRDAARTIRITIPLLYARVHTSPHSLLSSLLCAPSAARENWPPIVRITPLHPFVHPSAIAIIPGRYVFYTDGALPSVEEFAFRSFGVQSARKDALSSFASTETLLLVNKLASTSLPLLISFLLSLLSPSSVSRALYGHPVDHPADSLHQAFFSVRDYPFLFPSSSYPPPGYIPGMFASIKLKLIITRFTFEGRGDQLNDIAKFHREPQPCFQAIKCASHGSLSALAIQLIIN